MDSDIRVVEATAYFIPAMARTPLKFGGVVMDRLDYATVRVEVENRRGQRGAGWGGMFLSDVWAMPDERVPHDLRLEGMREVTRRYCKLVRGLGQFGHPIDLYFEVEDGLREMAGAISAELKFAVPLPFLGALVSASPVDAAVHDAFGIANGISSYEGYGRECMEHDLSRYLGPEFKGKYPADYIEKAFRPQVPVFHLVGGLDKLRRSEVDDSDPKDGLPNSMDEWIEWDDLFCLKVKLRGIDLEWDIARMLEVAQIAVEVRQRIGRHDLYFSADTNEMCETVEYMVEFLERVRERDPQAFAEILYVEQPTERDLGARRLDMRPIARLKPVLVDESLTGLEDFRAGPGAGLVRGFAEGLQVPVPGAGDRSQGGADGRALFHPGPDESSARLAAIGRHGSALTPDDGGGGELASVLPGLLRARGGRASRHLPPPPRPPRHVYSSGARAGLPDGQDCPQPAAAGLSRRRG